jgi:hypothetical protein
MIFTLILNLPLGGKIYESFRAASCASEPVPQVDRRATSSPSWFTRKLCMARFETKRGQKAGSSPRLAPPEVILGGDLASAEGLS